MDVSPGINILHDAIIFIKLFYLSNHKCQAEWHQDLIAFASQVSYIINRGGGGVFTLYVVLDKKSVSTI